MSRVVAALAVAAACLAPAGAIAQNREHQLMAAELRILQEQNQLLSLAVQKAMEQLEQAVKSINARLDESDQAARKAQADQKVQIETLTSELRVIKERTQDASARIGTLTEEVEAMRESMAALSAPPPAVVIDPFTGLPIDPPASSSAAPSPTPSALGISPSRLYQEAYNDYTIGLFDLAIDGFETYLREFPTYDQADRAQLLIGDSYMQLKRYGDAVTAYRAVIDNYPSEDSVPEAYLGLGQAQRAQGRIDEARQAWETVVQKYKDSSAAIIARQRLDGLPAR